MLRKRLGINSTVIYHGVDFRVFSPKISKKKCQKGCNSGDKKIVLSVTRMHPYKDPFTLIKAIPEVIKYSPNVKFIVIGSGPLLVKFINLSRQLRVFGNMLHIMHVPFGNLLKFYRSCDLFVHTSHLEMFGLTVMEAMACRKAVIVPDVGATPEIVGDAGLTFKHGNAEDLANKIILLLSNDDLRRKYALKALHRSREFTWEKAAAKYMQLYLSLL